MKLNVAQIQGLLANNFEVTVDADAALNFTEGSELVITNLTTSHMVVPYGTTTEWDVQQRVHQKTFLDGQIRYNTSDNQVEVYYDGGWLPLSTGTAAQDIGTQSNPAIDGNALMAAGKSSGIYWIQPEGQSAYQMYVDNSRNSGGWVLCAHVRTSTCQDHMTTNSVRISGTTGPRTNNTSTTKMSDDWIQALRNGSAYTGNTAYWLEATGFNKNMFVQSEATVNLNNSASEDNPRTRVSTSYQGALSDRGPNTGTRGFGDHHTSGGTYFAWGRHPESGNNCGFREDSLGASNGYLWVK